MSMIRLKLLRAGVKNLREFGYPGVDTVNIITDQVYSAFFKSMLKDNRGINPEADVEINALLKEIGGEP